MAVSRPPTDTDHNDVRLIQAFVKPGTDTLVWFEDPSTARPFWLVEWNGELYLPVENGQEIGIGLFNRSSDWRGYPIYVEGANLWTNGPSEPELCTPDQMWEIPGRQSRVFHHFFNVDTQQGRPLVMVTSGAGYAIGEASLGTTEFRGQIAIYQRLPRGQYGGITPPVTPRPWPGYLDDYPETRAGRSGTFGAKGGGLEAFGTRETFRSAGTKGGVSRGGGPSGFVPKGAGPAPKIHTDQQLGIGAGADEHVGSHVTGMQYGPEATRLGLVKTESRKDMRDVLAVARIEWSSWQWTPQGTSWWLNWVPLVPPTAPHVPVAPHRPHRPGYGYGA